MDAMAITDDVALDEKVTVDVVTKRQDGDAVAYADFAVAQKAGRVHESLKPTIYDLPEVPEKAGICRINVVIDPADAASTTKLAVQVDGFTGKDWQPLDGFTAEGPWTDPVFIDFDATRLRGMPARIRYVSNAPIGVGFKVEW